MKVVWAAIGSSEPMGQQVHERQIMAAIRAIADPDERFVRRELGGLRSAGPLFTRYPIGILESAPLSRAQLIGRFIYRTRDLVHRFDLRLPPHAGTEVVTVHDLPPLRFTDEGSLPRSARAGAQRAAAIIVPSRFAATEVEQLLGIDPQRISVIPNGVSPEFGNSDRLHSDGLRHLGITTDRYVLHAGGATERKNLASLASAWSQLCEQFADLSLCLVGPADARRDVAFCGLPRVTILDRQLPEMVAALMTSAAAVVVPSRYEGFGLPALEAMACGTPVVASNTGALAEVCDGAALLVEPEAQSLTDGLRAVLEPRSALADRLRRDGPARSAQFTWTAAADQHLVLYRKLAARPTASR